MKVQRDAGGRGLSAGSILTTALAGLTGLLLSGCGHHEVRADSVDPSKVVVEEAAGADTVEVDHPEQFATAEVQARGISDTLEVTGAVAPDVARTVPVVSLSGGRVIEIHARLGDDVQKDQPLLTITSPDVSAAFSDYQKAVSDGALAKRQLDRAELLISKGAYSQKDLESAWTAYDKTKVDLSTAAEHLRILGADVEHPSPVVEIRAPVSGTIVEQNITQGTGVKSLDNSPNLFTIADLSKVWILCDVFENDLAKVHMGDAARVRLNAYPDRVLQGRVSNIGRVLDPATRTAKVRLELDNVGMLLRPNMFATVTFVSGGAKMRAMIPATAILELHDKSWVFVPAGGKRFRRQEIDAGAMVPGGLREVISGLKPRDQVVTNALGFSGAADNKE